MKRLLARLVERAFDAYVAPITSGPFVNAYAWALEVLQPVTPELRAEWDRDRDRRTLLDAAELLEAGPNHQWTQQVRGFGNTRTWRCASAHEIAVDVRFAAGRLYPPETTPQP